jgi:hypothetical protein
MQAANLCDEKINAEKGNWGRQKNQDELHRTKRDRSRIGKTDQAWKIEIGLVKKRILRGNHTA